MKLTLERILIAGLTIIVIILVMRSCSRPSEQKEAERKEQYETQVAILQVEKATVQSRQDSLVRRYKEKVKADSSSLALQGARIQALQSKLTNQRPKVIERIQADTSVLSYVNTLEEVVTELQVQNDTLKSQANFQRKLHEDLIVAEFMEDRAEQQMFVEQSRRIDEIQKQSRKKERRSKLKTILVPIVAVVAFILGNQL